MTSVEIAERSHLDERYVREWASTMAAAGYVDYDPVDKTFRMNAEQARVLAREDNTFYTAGAFQYAVTCYRQIPRLMEAFQRGGGVPFAAFGPDIVEAIERLFHVGYETWVAREWIPAVPDVHERLIVGCEAAEVGAGRVNVSSRWLRRTRAPGSSGTTSIPIRSSGRERRPFVPGSRTASRSSASQRRIFRPTLASTA